MNDCHEHWMLEKLILSLCPVNCFRFGIVLIFIHYSSQLLIIKRVKLNIEKQIHVLLIQLHGKLQFSSYEPLAIEVLAGYVENHFPNCSIKMVIASSDESSIAELTLLFTEQDFDLIGMSVPHGTLHIAQDIFSLLAKSLAKKRLVSSLRPVVLAGGALPASLPELFLSFYPTLIIAKGWGESPLSQLILGLESGDLEYSKIPNIFFKKDNAIIKTQFSNIKIIPESPKLFTSEMRFGSIEASRGCHYGVCTFCLRPTAIKNDWFRIPTETVIKSIIGLKNIGCKKFTFVDEDFIGNDLDGAIQIAEEISNVGGMQFSMSLRSDSIILQENNTKTQENNKRYELFLKLKEAGLSRVFIGLESLSNTQLKRYGKGVSSDAQIYAINYLKSLNVEVDLGFIIFDPLVTFEELEENISKLESTSFWQNVGWMFQEMHIYKNTAYEGILAKTGLMGKLDPNLLEYEWNYKNENIAQIAKYCRALAKPIEPVYRIVRTLDRSTLDTSRSSLLGYKYRLALQELNLKVLKFAVEKSRKVDYISMRSQVSQIYNSSINSLFTHLSLECDLENPLQTRLMKEIQLYFDGNRNTDTASLGRR